MSSTGRSGHDSDDSDDDSRRYRTRDTDHYYDIPTFPRSNLETLTVFDQFMTPRPPMNDMNISSDNFELRARVPTGDAMLSESDNDANDRKGKRVNKGKRRVLPKSWRAESDGNEMTRAEPVRDEDKTERKVSFQGQDGAVGHGMNTALSVVSERTSRADVTLKQSMYDSKNVAGPQNIADGNVSDQDTLAEAFGDGPVNEGASARQDPSQSDDDSTYDLEDWDVFRRYTYDPGMFSNERLYDNIQKTFRVIFILISVIIILASMVTSKLSLLFATSHVNPYVSFRRSLGNCTGDTHTGQCTRGFEALNETAEDLYFLQQCGVPVKYSKPTEQQKDSVRWLWCVWMCMTLPYLITFMHSLWKICFKHKKTPTVRAVSFVMFMESLHVGGLMILLYICLPTLDIFRGILLLNATAIYPSFFKLFLRPQIEQNRGWQILADFLSFIMQLSSIGLYLGLTDNEETSAYQCHAEGGNVNFTTAMERCGPGPESTRDVEIYLIPIGLLLTSFGWWQNFLGKELQMSCARDFNRLNKEIQNGKTKIFAIVGAWKMVLSFALFLAIANFYSIPALGFKNLFGKGFEVYNDTSPFEDPDIDDDTENGIVDWVIVFGVNSVAGLICYITSLHAVQAQTQRSTYTVAVMLSTPVSFVLSIYLCMECSPDRSVAEAFGIDKLYWNCHDGFNNMEALLLARPMVVVGIIFWVSQMILGRHLWYPKTERLAKAGRIFVKPFYCGVLLEQSMTYNRSRRDKHRPQPGKLPSFDDEITLNTRTNSGGEKEIQRDRGAASHFRDVAGRQSRQDDAVLLTRSLAQMDEPLYDRRDRTEPMIFICATMWHENELEMVQMIKSIMRLDKHQCTRRLTRDFFRVKISDYYDFEAHIFFDDAFDQYIPGDPLFKVNRFVEMFVSVLNGAAMYVHSKNMKIPPPVKMPTPYGGRLVYTLPGGNTLTLHLKDKQKIRHKKRWSQVMYMYYLFGYRLWNQPIDQRVKEIVAYNTYVLTLDGDVDFRPEAVLLLLDLMKRNYSVGASCGRIHPEGHGPMVWYQKFEYALAHWLQKSTEHILGCVLCSPGCFSLFRAAALMDDNIMNMYSKKAESALEHVQYDQGEDRWLCTLMLQRGYRVEYAAAADALTFAPEGFNEFFNQRRRWTPSTFANILDLLRSGRQTVARNENISFMYIVYQGGLFASSILGPATIFLMFVGSFALVFDMDMVGAFFLTFIPVGFFFLLCMVAPSSIQLGFAALLGGLFGVGQMVVLVGIIASIATDGLCNPTTWFLLLVSGIFLMSAILHPREFTNVLHGVLYFLLVPTMYLLLIIYSLCNLNVISWGTREVVQTNVEKEKLKLREAELAAHAQKNPSAMSTWLGGMFGSSAPQGKEDGWTISCGSACRCLCCPRPGESPIDKSLGKIEKMAKMLVKKTTMRDDPGSSSDDTDVEAQTTLKSLYSGHTKSDAGPEVVEESSPEEDPAPDYHEFTEEQPYWTTLRDSVDKGPVKQLGWDEKNFWGQLIEKYLQPIDKDREREERISKSLKELRNKAVIAFFLIDMLFIVLIQTLAVIPTAESDASSNVTAGYYVQFQCQNPGEDAPRTFDIDPIGFAFLLVFGLFLVIQFFGMLLHRLFTLLQVVSSTIVCKRESEDPGKAYYAFATELMDTMNDDLEGSVDGTSFAGTDNCDPYETNAPPRHPLHHLGTSHAQSATMEHSFAKNFLALQEKIKMLPQVVIDNKNPKRPSIAVLEPDPDSSQPHARKMSEHVNVFNDMARRRATIFNERITRQMRAQYDASDVEISKLENKLNRKFIAMPYLPPTSSVSPYEINPAFHDSDSDSDDDIQY